MVDLILLESVTGLGRPGDKVRVRPGYASNFLLPQRKASPVNADVMRNLDKLKAKAEEEERAMVGSMTELAGKLAGAEVEIQARATEEGHLFGSVTEKDIQDALEAAGWELPVRCVRLELHVKEAGSSEAVVHLYGTIEATVKVNVVPVDAEGNVIDVVAETSEAAAPEAAADGEDDGEEADTEVAAEGDAEDQAAS